ncbi:MAG: Na(+)-translocating NADH-quinone reductase subunit A [Tidjanibacter sp.]|nr:Na(+)-translocating NADH-quinone reductase subunit A [Tidjanibacter sp.]
MSKVIKLKKGLDIKLVGEADKSVVELPIGERYAVSPLAFEGVVPKLLVAEGDKVMAGDALFYDKAHPEVMFTSPVSGTISAVRRGEKRKLLAIEVAADVEQTYKPFNTNLATASREEVVAALLESGLWAMIIQRPYGIIADSNDTPKAIFVSGFDSAPLAADMNIALEGDMKAVQAGFDALRKLCGKVHLGLRAGQKSLLEGVEGVEKHYFAGAHPAGNVGVQIHHIDPVNKGEKVWTVAIQNVAIIGRLFTENRVNMTKTWAVVGSQVAHPMYVRGLVGSSVADVIMPARIKPQSGGATFRIIEGNVLSGVKVSANDYVGCYSSQVSVIPEGGELELIGWLAPRLNKFSVSRTYFSWLMPKKKYDLRTGLNGGVRPFVVTGLYEKYLPMDIYPMYLFKAIMAGDIEKMENLGIYEIIEEDVALCEFVDPSKQELQALVRDGINLMIKEM